MKAAPLLTLAWLSASSASRLTQHLGSDLRSLVAAEGGAEGSEDKASSFCTMETGPELTTLACGEASAIRVASVFYNRAKRGCSPGTEGVESCSAKEDHRIKDKCDGKASCQLSPADHNKCSQNPFYKVKIKFACEARVAAATPEDADVTQQQQQQQAAVSATKDEPDVTAELEFSDPDGLPTDTGKDGLQILAKDQAIDFARSQDMGEALPALPLKMQPDEEAKTVVPKPSAPKKNGAKHAMSKNTVIQDRNHPGVQINPIPCFRSTRSDLVAKAWKLMSPSIATDRLTNCDETSGCFRVDMRDGSKFSDPDSPPTLAQLLDGHLVEGEDSKSVAMTSLGILRAETHTWGLCLPKTGPKVAEYAKKLFAALARKYG